MYVYRAENRRYIASPNVNHFCGNCESLWLSDSPNVFGTANHFWPITNQFSNGFAETFFGSSLFLDKISFFLDKCYIYIRYKNAY